MGTPGLLQELSCEIGALDDTFASTEQLLRTHASPDVAGLDTSVTSITAWPEQLSGILLPRTDEPRVAAQASFQLPSPACQISLIDKALAQSAPLRQHSSNFVITSNMLAILVGLKNVSPSATSRVA